MTHEAIRDCGTKPYARKCARRLGRIAIAEIILAAGIAIASLGFAGQARSESNYPVKPIRLMTAFAPGGGSDILARLLSPPVSAALGQTIVVDNRPGGGGTLGAGLAVRAQPDGYTLIIVSGSYGANAALHSLPYDSVEDITPIMLIGETGLVATMFPKSPIRSVSDLIAYAKNNPGKLLFGSAGTGGLGHLALELFKLYTKVDITHVPYKGSGPVMTALLAGEVHSSFSSIVPSMPHIKAGRLRPIGVTPPHRVAVLPDVPTIGETVPGFEVVHWYGLWGPKGIPHEIVARLNKEFATVLGTSAMKKWFANEGMDPAGGPPEQFRQRIKNDVEKWKKLVKEAHIKISLESPAAPASFSASPHLV
jgi:tripartite-type tricarboxylate transporter receptor subunit TctC